MIVIASAAYVVVAAWLAPGAADEQASRREEMAQTLVRRMAAGEFSAAVKSFDDTMKKALSADKLQQAWEAVVEQQGPLQQTGEMRTERQGAYQVVFVTAEFRRGKLEVKVVFNDEQQIAGLFFVPAGQYRPPAYADPTKFEEMEVTIGGGLWSLPGTLTRPKGEGPFPAVVLVHGSGPHDRDETLGPNKPFRDLAHGLASRGIAVLRYEKRTKHHPLKMVLLARSITVREETVEDAVAAVATLAEQEKIDPRRVFVLGHSLGGMLLPRIAAESDRIAGLISFAGSTRALDDLVLAQTKYLAALDGTVSEAEQQALEQLEEQVARVRSAELSPDADASELPLGVHASYWLDLRGYDPADAAKNMMRPMLILNGERDYQVTMEDFARWKAALEGRDDVKFLTYPKLSHLFMEGEGPSSPAEYATPGNVAEAVIRDIAAWVKEQPPR